MSIDGSLTKIGYPHHRISANSLYYGTIFFGYCPSSSGAKLLLFSFFPFSFFPSFFFPSFFFPSFFFPSFFFSFFFYSFPVFFFFWFAFCFSSVTFATPITSKIRFVVNYAPALYDLITEAKYFEILELPIPEAAMNVVLQVCLYKLLFTSYCYF